MKKNSVIFLIWLSTITILPQFFSVRAQCGGLTFPGGQTVFGSVKKCELGTAGGVISGFLPSILAIAGFITVIIIVISGIQFITSSGNPEGAAAARNRLTYALVGFALIVLAFAVLQIINRIFLATGVT